MHDCISSNPLCFFDFRGLFLHFLLEYPPNFSPKFFGYTPKLFGYPHFSMAGMKGFEPLHGGFRVHSLTAWLHPNDLVLLYSTLFSKKVNPENFSFSGKF